MAISTFVQRLVLGHPNQRHSKAMKRHECDLDHAGVVVVPSPLVVLDESLPVVLVASPPVVVATLLPGVSHGVLIIRSKRMAGLKYSQVHRIT